MKYVEKAIIETERLYMRRLEESDFDALCRTLCDNETMYAYEGAFDKQEAREWLDRQLARYERWGFGLRAVLLKDTDTFVGQCGLTMQPWKDSAYNNSAARRTSACHGT